jgi:hypothetical protein
MTIKLLNRLIYILPTLFLFSLHYQKTEKILVENWVDLTLIIIVLLLLFWLIYEFKDFYDFHRRRRKHILNPKLYNGIRNEISGTFFNLKITDTENELQIFEQTDLQFYYNKNSKKAEFINSMTANKAVDYKDIEYIVFEFYEMHLLVFKNNNGKNKWYCKFSAKLKNSNKTIKIATMVSTRDNVAEMFEHRDIDRNEFYFRKGLEIANILSSSMDLKFLIINHLEKDEKVTEQIEILRKTGANSA